MTDTNYHIKEPDITVNITGDAVVIPELPPETPEQKLDNLMTTSPYKGNEMIEHEKEIVDLLVQHWNNIVGDYENRTIMWAMKVQELIKTYPDKTVKAVLDKIRSHPDLKSPMHSRDRIYSGLRLVRTKPKVIEWIQMTPAQRREVPEEDAPYHKDNAAMDLQTEFYLTLGKWSLDPGFEWELEMKAKQDKWSYRKLIQEVQKLRVEIAEPNTMRRLQKAAYIKELVVMLKDLQPDELNQIKSFVLDKYSDKLVSWKKWQDSKETKE